MKRLILMRHAKSDWSDGALTDLDRGLNARGKRSASAMGDWLRSQDLKPDQVLCSAATRTQETLEHLGLDPEISVTRSRTLYLASADAMIKTLRAQQAHCVLILAHNPGCAVLADMLVRDAPKHPRFEIYPTCATLVVDFDIQNWNDLPLKRGQVVHFIVPRDLTD